MEDTIINAASNQTMLDFIYASIVGLISWFFGGVDSSLKILLAMIVIDYVTGLSVAWTNDTLSSAIGFKGITKKCIMITFVGIAHLMDTTIPDDPGAIRYGVCIFYIANEGKSIIENAYKLGVPFPQALLKHFDFMHKDEKNIEREKAA